MGATENIAIGLMGLGVVGSGVVSALTKKAHTLAAHVGSPLAIRRILVRDISKARAGGVPRDLVTAHAADILEDPHIGIVVEVMGGEQPALDYIQEALSRGKHVVTANKEVMAKHGPEVFSLAKKKKVRLLFEASVGGGIPVVRPLLQDLLGNDITSVYAIINGTSNYILTRMAQEGMNFAVALEEAQARGYAEADPTNDIEGIDAAYKLAILSSLAFHTEVRAGNVYHEGISRLTAYDFRYAKELGYSIKLLAIARREDMDLQLRVHPALVPQEHLLAKVDGVFNAVEVEGDLVGKVLFHGEGAGAAPTSSAVVADIVDIARGMVAGFPPAAPLPLDRGLHIKPMEDLETRFYLRICVLDQPGVLAQISHILGDLNVSIASVIQKETYHQEGTAELVITTHSAREMDMQEALRRIAQLPAVPEVRNFIRVEE